MLSASSPSPILAPSKRTRSHVLPSAGVTQPQHYYDPVRHPPWAAVLRTTSRPLPSPAMGLPPITRVHPSDLPCPLPRWTWYGCVCRLLPRPTGPSPYSCGRRPRLHFRGLLRLHSRDGLPDCSPPKAPLSTGFGPPGYPTNAARQLPRSTDNSLGGSFLHWCTAPLGRTE